MGRHHLQLKGGRRQLLLHLLHQLPLKIRWPLSPSKHGSDNVTDESIFANCLANELKKISDPARQQRVKRQLMKVVMDGVDEDMQQQQQQMSQYFMLSEDGSVQLLNVPEQ